MLPSYIKLNDAKKSIADLLANNRQHGKDMIAFCFLSHGGPNKTIIFSDGRAIRLGELLNVNSKLRFYPILSII